MYQYDECQWYPAMRDKRLYAAVLARALEDLHEGSPTETESALKWFRRGGSSEDKYLSYEFIKNALDLGASRTRFIKSAIKTGEERSIRMQKLPNKKTKIKGLFVPSGYRKYQRRTLAT